MNDGALSAEAIRLRFEGYDENLAVYPTPDFAAVAKGFGWKAETIHADADMAELFRAHRWHDGPLLIDARISRDIIVDPVAVKDLSRKPR
jgi:thiamine pyrophosphate-dependent acetolactate synthase large subunit-like protein